MIRLLDCTFRDGGYYNSWDFPFDIIQQYLDAMSVVGVNIVEIGLRSLKNKGFSGACAYTTDEWIRGFNIPSSLTIGVMVNAAEIIGDIDQQMVLSKLFPLEAKDSPISLVRIACHAHEFIYALPAVHWLKERGYQVCFNLMQVTCLQDNEVAELARQASRYPLDALYFADSMGSMKPDQAANIIAIIRRGWHGSMGIHTHDNMGLSLQNTLRAAEEGVTWLDATVTGMGRGPGNARIEDLAIEVADMRQQTINIGPLMTLIRQYFTPMKFKYGWGTNPYYYLSGKFGIHPTYVQEMLGDLCYSEEDILAAIEHLRTEGGKKFNIHTLDAAHYFYRGTPVGHWAPAKMIQGREVLLLATGTGVKAHSSAIERYIHRNKPVVIALNTQSAIATELINVRIACHPFRLLADCETHIKLGQPLITPASMLPQDVKFALRNKTLLDFGLLIKKNTFSFSEKTCVIPTPLVVGYALAVANSGKATRILMAGFDGYLSDDPRTKEMRTLLEIYHQTPDTSKLLAVTPSRYEIDVQSIYAM